MRGLKVKIFKITPGFILNEEIKIGDTVTIKRWALDGVFVLVVKEESKQIYNLLPDDLQLITG